MTWIKAAGLFGVFLCCLAAGIYYSNRLYKRAAFLETVEKWCAYTASQIRYTCAPIRDIWCDAAVKPEFAALPFLNALTDADWKETVYRGIAACGASMYAAPADMSLVWEWLDGLGSSDMDGQISHCTRYEEQLSCQYTAAKERAAQVGKLYISLGFFGGICAVLLLG